MIMIKETMMLNYLGGLNKANRWTSFVSEHHDVDDIKNEYEKILRKKELFRFHNKYSDDLTKITK